MSAESNLLDALSRIVASLHQNEYADPDAAADDIEAATGRYHAEASS